MDRLLLLGTSHRQVDPSKLGLLRDRDLEDCLLQPSLQGTLAGFVSLVTCNRFELYLEPVEKAGDKVKKGLLPLFRDLPAVEAKGLDAVRHLIRVAGSLESMVLGENQILGQVKRARQAAVERGSITPLLDEVFRQAVSGAREIRNQTGLGTQPVSVASLACWRLSELLRAESRPLVAILGAGAMAHKAATALGELRRVEFLFVNRSIEKAVELARRHGGRAFSLAEFLENPQDVDALLVAVRCEAPVLDGTLFQRMSSLVARDEPLPVVDLGVPRCVTPEVSSLETVRMIDMDELHRLSERHSEEQRSAARAAEPIAERFAVAFRERLRARDLGLDEVRQAHVELAEQRAELLLSGELGHLSEPERARFKRRIIDLAKAHAHLHVKNLRARAASR